MKYIVASTVRQALLAARRLQLKPTEFRTITNERQLEGVHAVDIVVVGPYLGPDGNAYGEWTRMRDRIQALAVMEGTKIDTLVT